MRKPSKYVITKKIYGEPVFLRMIERDAVQRDCYTWNRSPRMALTYSDKKRAEEIARACRGEVVNLREVAE